MFEFLNYIMTRFSWSADETATFACASLWAVWTMAALLMALADYRHLKEINKYGMKRIEVAEKRERLLMRYDFRFAVFIIIIGVMSSIGGLYIGAWFLKVAQPDMWAMLTIYAW